MMPFVQVFSFLSPGESVGKVDRQAVTEPISGSGHRSKEQDHSKQHHITYPNNPVLFYGISHGPELVLLVYKNGCTSHWTSIAY